MFYHTRFDYFTTKDTKNTKLGSRAFRVFRGEDIFAANLEAGDQLIDRLLLNERESI